MSRGKRRLAATMISLLTLMLVGCEASSPDRATKEFLTLLKEEKHVEAQDKLSSHYKEMVVSMMGGIKNSHLKPYYRSSRLASFEILNVDAAKESARAHVRVTDTEGGVHEDDIELVVEDGKWKVANF